MLLSVLYAIVCLLRCRGSTAREVELLGLRHEVGVQRRATDRRAYRPGDRPIPASSRSLPRTAWHIFPVRPETLLRWQRELARRKWAAFGRRRGPGRPLLPTDIRV